MIQYTINKTDLQCLFRYMFRPARSSSGLKLCKIDTKFNIPDVNEGLRFKFTVDWIKIVKWRFHHITGREDVLGRVEI
jgi:hypothetical protein